MKLSQVFEKTKEIQIKANTRAVEHAQLASFFRDLSQNVQDYRDQVDAMPEGATEADGHLSRFETMLEQGPPDGSPLGGEAAEQKPEPKRRLPKGLMAKMIEVSKSGPVSFDAYAGLYDAETLRAAAEKAGLKTWASQDSGGACFWFGLPEHANSGTLSRADAEPLNDMNTRAPRQTDAEKAAKAAEFGAEVKAADQERVALAARIRSCREGNPGALPSEIAEALGLPLQAVRDAWRLLTGEKAP